MGAAIKNGFANLTNFSGRDSRSLFWWWVLFVVIVTFGLSMLVGIVFTAGSMGSAFQSAAAGVDQAQVEAEMMQNMAGNLGAQAWAGVAVSLLGLALLIASFVRRLRDAGLPPIIAIVPVATTLFSAYVSVSAVGEMSELMASGDLVALEEAAMGSASLGLVAYVGYLVILVCGLIPSKNAE